MSFDNGGGERVKPQYCLLSSRDFRCEWFHTGGGGELVRFRDFEPLPEGYAGQPQGLEWFCREHALAARELAHLSSTAALAALQERFGEFPPVREWSLVPDPSLWVTSVGPHPARVFAVVHQASGLPASKALALLRSLPFELARGWPISFESWRDALVAAGAGVEVRYG
jgi:hypothetical protein